MNTELWIKSPRDVEAMLVSLALGVEVCGDDLTGNGLYPALKFIGGGYQRAKQALRDHGWERPRDHWRADLTQIGLATLSTLKKYLAFNEDLWCQQMTNKHLGYGAGALREWGELGIIVRIGAKLMRSENLQLQGRHCEVFEELTDILGYVLLGIYMLDHQHTIWAY